jgi:hypothetical protein
LLIERAERRAGTLRCDQEYIEVCTGLDETEAHRQAVAEAKRSAAAKIGLHLTVQRRMGFVGREHHDDVRGSDGILQKRGGQARRFCFEHASGLAPKSDNHVNAAVVQVERLRAPLVAIAEDRHALPVERSGIDVGIAQQVHGRRLALWL